MQQPRRTSEFHEEPGAGGTATKRQSARLTQQQRLLSNTISPAPGTAQKYASSRPSRIPSRSSSTDRAVGAGPASLLVPNSAARVRGTTPQQTPLKPQCNATRELFTAEKQRPSAAPQNDKRWVQERVQCITEQLREAVVMGRCPGLMPDFFGRTGLRQMSNKQFVAIVNYFLQFACGNRFTVGASHVEDIVTILQRLHYRHPVNKSWLKTPTAQHSFGNVVLLLDFLMEFLPQNDEAETLLEFDFDKSPAEDQRAGTATCLGNTTLLQMPDVEFQAQLVRNAEEGFALWDKQQLDKFSQLQRQSCDALILKRCGLSGGVDALDADLVKLHQALDEMQACRVPVPERAEQRCRQMEQELKHMQQVQEMLDDDMAATASECKQFEPQRQTLEKEVARITSEVSNLDNIVINQTCSVLQRDELVEEAAQLKHMMKIQKRTMRELRDRDHTLQIAKSGITKKVSNQVEVFNARMREIAYSGLHGDANALQLPLDPKCEDVELMLPQLKVLQTQMVSKMQQDSEQLAKRKEIALELSREVELVLEPRSEHMKNALTTAQKLLVQREHLIREDRSKYDAHVAQLDAHTQQLQHQIVALEHVVLRKQTELIRLQQLTEDTMNAAEQDYEARTTTRDVFLVEYGTELEKAESELQQITEKAKQNAVFIEQLKRALDNENDDANVAN